jgi:hypothetical protein
MSEAKRQFFIEGYVTGVSGRHTVIGRNGDVPIRLGDTFTAVVRYRPRRYPDDFDKPPEIEMKKEVSLRVIWLHAYEQELDELGEGTTGSVALEGEGADRLGQGWVLEA